MILKHVYPLNAHNVHHRAPVAPPLWKIGSPLTGNWIAPYGHIELPLMGTSQSENLLLLKAAHHKLSASAPVALGPLGAPGNDTG